jgi:hypothetical protein
MPSQAINAGASRINRVHAKTAWAALLQDYEAYEATERGIKVFIKAVVNNPWICDLCNPETFYSNVTALTIQPSVSILVAYMPWTWYCSPFK